MADLITQSDIELRMGEADFARFCDDDGDGVADTGPVKSILAEASAIAKDILWSAFPSVALIEGLMSHSPSAKGAVCDIACALAGKRRREFLGPDGKNPYSDWKKDGEAMLERIAKGERRLSAEETQGRNQTIGNRVNRSDDATFQFAFPGTRKNPHGPGGY